MYAVIDLCNAEPETLDWITARLSAHAEFGNLASHFAVVSNRILLNMTPAVTRAFDREMRGIARLACEAGYYCEADRAQRCGTILAGDGAILHYCRWEGRTVEVVVGVIAEWITRSPDADAPAEIAAACARAEALAEATVYARLLRDERAAHRRWRASCRKARGISGRLEAAWRVPGTAEAGTDAQMMRDLIRYAMIVDRANARAAAATGGAPCA
jgi:hypothetical protein